MPDTPPTAAPTSNVESLTLRMLSDMRREHAAAMEAVRQDYKTMRRLYANMERMFDSVDALRAEVAAFRAEMTTFRADAAKHLRKIESDVITAEGNIISRQIEIAEAVNRIGEPEVREIVAHT